MDLGIKITWMMHPIPSMPYGRTLLLSYPSKLDGTPPVSLFTITAMTPAALKVLQLPASIRIPAIRSSRTFSVLNRPPPKYEGHVPLTIVERGALAVGSAVMSLFNPRRGGERSRPIEAIAFSEVGTSRSHRSPRRDDVDPVLYLPLSRRHALFSYGSAYPAGQTAHHFTDNVP